MTCFGTTRFSNTTCRLAAGGLRRALIEAWRGWLTLALLAALAGCNKNPFLSNQPTQPWGAQAAQSPQANQQLAQLQTLAQQVSQLDANNRDLHLQLARSEQEILLSRQERDALQKQLGDVANQLQATRAAREASEQQLASLEATTRLRGGATLTANNSFRQALSVARVEGLSITPDGDVVRVALPADELFVPGSAALKPSAHALLDRAAAVIQRHYRGHMVGVEGHVDAQTTPDNGHQLAGSQSLGVLQQLASRHQLPAKQLFFLSHGANHPKASNATPAGRALNRRVELVIYPDKVDGG